MFPQQPMRRPPGLQRPSRMIAPRNPGMGMAPPSGQQQGFQQFFNPMGAPQQAAARGGGIQGFLSKFLPGGSAASGGTGTGLGGAGTGLGGIQNFANPASISSMLGNVQKALGVAQQVTPMIQQYGPLVRNLPGMVKMLRQLNTDDSETSESEEQKDDERKDEAESGKLMKSRKKRILQNLKNHKRKRVRNNQAGLCPLLKKEQAEETQNLNCIYNIL